MERRRGEWRAGSETGDNIITCRRIAPRDVNAASRNDLHGSWSVGRGLWVMAEKHSAAVSRERCIERIQTKRKEYTGHCDSPAHGRITPGKPKKRPIDLRSALRGPRLSTAAGELGSRAEGASNVKNKMRRREERGSEICMVKYCDTGHSRTFPTRLPLLLDISLYPIHPSLLFFIHIYTMAEQLKQVYADKKAQVSSIYSYDFRR